MDLLKASLVLIFGISFFLQSSAQSNFYNVDSVQDLELNFYDDNWDYLLDSLYIEGEGNRILAQAVINGESYDSVGVLSLIHI